MVLSSYSQNVSSTSKEREEKTSPGLYGPIETSSRRRRSAEVKEGTASDKPKQTSQEKEEPKKEEEKPKEESVEEIVARRRARREARRNVRLGITSAHEKESIPDKKEESKPVKKAEEKTTAKAASSAATAKVQESATDSPRMRRRRDRQSGHQSQLSVDESAEPGLKLPLSPKVRDQPDREMFSDTTNDSEQESISLRSDSDIRRRFESILAHRRRESSDSVSSSRRSSPSTGRLYDSNFTRNKANGDVQNLRKKFTGANANVAQAGPVKQKSKSLKYEKERPREGSVKALTQTFGAAQEEKKNGSGSNKSSPRSLSPASSTGSVSTGIAEKIKKLKAPSDIERPLERRKSADLIKARVAHLEHDKSAQPETEHRKSMPAIQAVRSKFERTDSQESPLPSPKKSSGKISYTVSVTDSDKENSESSKQDDRSARQKSRTAKLVAVMETPGSDKKAETVTFTVNSHARKRYGTVVDNKNNSNSKHIEQGVKDTPVQSVEKEATKVRDRSKVKPEAAKKEDAQAPGSKDEGDAREKSGRRRRRERHRASTQEDKKGDSQKPEAVKTEPPKTESPKPEPAIPQKASPEKTTDVKESHQDVNQESGKKGRRRHRQRKGQTEESGDTQKTAEPKTKEPEVIEKQEKVQEKEERRRYEKKEDVTKPSERHIQKKDKESTLTTLKRMVSKREETRPDVKIRDPARAKLEGENSIESVEGQDYPDLLAQSRLHDKEKSNVQDDNGKRRPHSMVAESGLKGAAAAIGQPIPKAKDNENEDKEKEKDKPKEAEEDDRRSRKETTRRGRFMAKADKFDLFRRARSVGPGKSKDRSPSAERKSGSKGLRSSSIDRSKVAGRAKSPGPVKSGKKKGGSIGGFLKASK